MARGSLASWRWLSVGSGGDGDEVGRPCGRRQHRSFAIGELRRKATGPVKVKQVHYLTLHPHGAILFRYALEECRHSIHDFQASFGSEHCRKRWVVGAIRIL